MVETYKGITCGGLLCADLTQKIGEQTWLPWLTMAVEIACFVIINFGTLSYWAKFILLSYT